MNNNQNINNCDQFFSEFKDNENHYIDSKNNIITNKNFKNNQKNNDIELGLTAELNSFIKSSNIYIDVNNNIIDDIANSLDDV